MGPSKKWDFFAAKNKRPNEQEFQEKGVIVVLQYGVHCKNCIHQMKKCCQNMKGVISVELDKEVPELITVKGVFEVKKLLTHIRRGVQKIVTVIKEETATAGSSTAVGSGGERREAAGGEGSSGGANHEIEEEEEEDGDGEIRVIYDRHLK